MRPGLPLLALLLLLLVGCKPKDEATEGSSASGGVAPTTSGAAGGMTPVTGSEGVEGAGSGVNSSALDAAHRAAAKVRGAPSAGGGDVGGEYTVIKRARSL